MDVESAIETIALALAARDGHGGGRATAMIGAGFSRNAQPSSESNRKFPLWRDIVRPLIDELLPPCRRCPRSDMCPEPLPPGCLLGDRRRRLIEDAAGASGMMALGDKFEAQKGSARLRAALETAVPDDDYEPGLAHQLLVRLPWADIFTTNWDSLLERAVDTYDRSYDTVVTVEQIASTSAPRIVKLHGCARSGSRLIFTEEDFRTYPKEFAPFVSLVQQSLMENVVVLFGFSGADPNFRAWHGWVRDHLGKNIQPIYLVTLRPTDPIDVNLMAGRLINQIDLSQKPEWQQASPNEVIEGFLSEIHRRLRSLRVNLDWPASRRKPSDDDPSTKPATSHQDWQHRLDLYPRWLVAPAHNRSDLLIGLDEALSLAFQKVRRGGLADLSPAKREDGQSKPPTRKADFLNEQEKTALIVAESLRIGLARPGAKLLDDLKLILATALNDLFAAGASDGDLTNPFTKLNSRIAELLRDIEDAKAKDAKAQRAQNIIDAKLAERAFANGHSPRENVLKLLPLIEIVEREARLREDEAVMGVLRDVLWMAGGEGPGRELAVRSELASALTHLRIQEIDSWLALWPDQPHDAASNLRRAATLREIGWIKESYKEIHDTVDRLRSLGSARRHGVGEASREAWAFYLYADLLEANKETLKPIIAPKQRHLKLDEVIMELHERLDELETNRCDPRREIDRLHRELASATIQATIQMKLSGEPAPASNIRPPLKYIVADPASTFIVLSETVGLSANHSYTGSRFALTAARLLARTNRKLAIGLLLRGGTPEDLRFTGVEGSGQDRDADIIRLTDHYNWPVADEVFDKANCLADFNTLEEILDSLLAQSSERPQDLVDPPYLDRKIRLLQHLIAGLIMRERANPPTELVEKGFALACRIARSSVVAATRAGWANQSQLFDAVLGVLPRERAVDTLTNLLDIPIPGDIDEALAVAWPDPFRLLTEAWYPKKSEGAEPGKELRDLGWKIVNDARECLAREPARRGMLEKFRQSLQSMTYGDRSQGRLIVVRRIWLLDQVLS